VTRSPERVIRWKCPRVLVELFTILALLTHAPSSATALPLPHSDPSSEEGRLVVGGVPGERSFQLPASATTDAPFEYRLLVVLVEFRDVQSSTGESRITPEEVYDRIFGEAGGTLASYWKEASGGRMTIRGTVTPWVRVDSTYAWYCSEGEGNQGSGIDPKAYPNNAPRLVEEAVGRIAESYRFGDYDNNVDGFVDGLLVLHAGPGLEEATTGSTADPRRVFLAHQFHTRNELPVSGSHVFDYGFVSALAGHGVASHEFGHLLGLTDLYDTGFLAGRNGPFGVGDWSLMGTGGSVGGGDAPTGLDADSRIRLGFVTPQVIPVGDAAREIVVNRGENPVYRLAAGDDPREYFLVEPRWRNGIDAGLPGEGFLIWHVDEREPANRGPDPYRVALVQPDGRNDLGRPNGNRGDAGDVWPTTLGTARNHWDDSTTPSARTNSGMPTSVSIREMSAGENQLSARVDIAPAVAIELVDLDVTEIDGDGDGQVESGETAALDVLLGNGGAASTGPLTLTLVVDPLAADDFLAGPAVSMESIPAGGSVRSSESLRLTVLSSGTAPTAAGALLRITGPFAAPLDSIGLLVPLRPGAAMTLSATPGEPEWRAVSLNPGQPAPWSVTTERFRTAPSAWRLGPTTATSYDTGLDALWQSPAFVVPDSHPQLIVWSCIDAETLSTGRAFDGGRLEIRSGLSDWEVLSPAGGWPFRLESGSGNALSGEEAFSGHDNSFHRLVFDLSAHADRAARIRYRFASDDITATDQGQSGWWLDDFEISSTGSPPDTRALAQADSVVVSWIEGASAPGTWLVYRRADVWGAVRLLIWEVAAPLESKEWRTSIVDHPPAGRWIYSIRLRTSDGPGLEYDAATVETYETTTSPDLLVYPNPYRLDGPPLNIDYLLPGDATDLVPVTIRMFDVAGRLVETILDEVGTGGRNDRRWPSDSAVSQPVPGVYFLRLDVAGQAAVRRRLVIRR